MKKRKWIYLVLTVLCVAAFYAYRAVDQSRTDTKAPEISISTEALEISVQDSKAALLQGVSAKDETDGDVTSSLVVESVRLADSDGTIYVTYAAFDKSGNVTKAERQARYTDYQCPRFSLRVPLAFSQNTSFDVLNMITVKDTLDGDISHRVRATCLDESAINTLGTHDVQFRVSNSLGDTVELVIPVEVYSAGIYQANLTLTDYLIYLDVGSEFHAESYLDTYTLGSATVSLQNGLPQNYSLRTTGRVNTNTPGVYSVAFQVTYTRENGTDSSLNQSYTGYSKLIVVVEG